MSLAALRALGIAIPEGATVRLRTAGAASELPERILISDEHMRLFKTYNVDVGVSIDGPGELNDLRWHVSLERTRRNTETVLANIERLCREHRKPGLIVTLHRLNASADRLPRLHAWVRQLDALGIVSMRLHLLEVESEDIRQAYSLSDEENMRALLSFADLQAELKHLRFDVLDEMERSLLGQDRHTSCVWRACDPYTTEAVRGIEGNGQSSNCGRTNKDGIDFVKAERPGYERYLALYQTPQEHSGCHVQQIQTACAKRRCVTVTQLLRFGVQVGRSNRSWHQKTGSQVCFLPSRTRSSICMNLTQASVTGRIVQLGPTYGRISNIQRGALVKLGLNVEF